MDLAEASPATGRETAMWLLEQLVPGSGVNNLNVTFRVEGALRPDLLGQALRVQVRRHDVLRTVFHADGGTLTKRVMVPEEAEPTIAHRDSTEETLTADLDAFVAEPFTLKDDQLLVRAALFRLPDAHVFCLVAHHLIVDAMSMSILQNELVGGYDTLLAGKTLSVEQVQATPEAAPAPASVEFWRSLLDGYVPSASSLRVGKQDLGEPTLSGDAVQRDLSTGARDVVHRLRRELHAPESVILLAAYYLLLSLHGAGSDLIVGLPVSTRPPNALSAIGYHINVLPLRVRVDPSGSFRALVAATRSIFLEALGHASVPAELFVARDARAWRSPLFRFLFNYVPHVHDAVGIDFTIGGLAARQLVEVENGFSRFDLEFFVPPLPSAERIRIRAVFRNQVFTRDEVELLLSRYDELIVTVGGNVERPVDGWPQPAREDKPAPVPTTADDGGPDWLVNDLLALWRELLRRDGIEADANFFTSGGNSLMGALLVQRIKKSINVPVKLADLFANPTPNMLAARLRERLP
ncbi:MAG TPA: condensation domain-containing protein [Pyrinomonadaceae bacterium]|jgi:hypothetical protein